MQWRRCTPCLEVRTAVRHGDDVCTRSIHHEIGIGRDERAVRGVTAAALFNPPAARPEEGKNTCSGGGREKEVGRNF